MIETINIDNLGPIKKINWEPSKNFNLVLGKNDTGKTLLLKALYSANRSLEDHGKGDSKKSFKQTLDEKLFWTFQVGNIGVLVNKKGDKLRFESKIDGQHIFFHFSPSAKKGVGECNEVVNRRDNYSVFIPAKEVLSLAKVIRKSRNMDQEFGFDNTYLDLLNYLDKPTTKGGGKYVVKARRELEKFIDGKIDRNTDGTWQLKRGNTLFDIFTTAEGIKKISIFDRLIGNKVLNNNTVIFIDEPEAHLHPQAIIMFLNVLTLLAKQGMQIYMTTHSYFVIRKLYLIAQDENWKLPTISLENGNDVSYYDLKNGMPKNSIIQTSIDLFQKEVENEI